MMMNWTRRSFLRAGAAASAVAAGISQSSKSAWAQSGPPQGLPQGGPPQGGSPQGFPPAPPTPSGGNAAKENDIPVGATIAINDLLDHGTGGHLKKGAKVLILAYIDGLYGGDNLVDRDAIHWIEQAVRQRGAIPEIFWINEQPRFGEWTFPKVVQDAFARNDMVINHSFNFTVEEIRAFNQYVETSPKYPMVRNFATTAPLLCTAWAQTPQELVSEIRYQASLHIQANTKLVLTDPNGTHMEATVLAPRGGTYATRREEGYFLPWPEWVVSPISLGDANGTVVFDRTLSWWSRYIGVPPVFDKPVQLRIEGGRIVKIEGGMEAEAFRAFLQMLKDKEQAGSDAYLFNAMHFGVHPQARVAPHQCPSALYRRLIEHSDSRNIHVHLGTIRGTKVFPYWPHITGDLRNATLKIGDFVMHDSGRLTVLDDPAVTAIVAKYPGRPGIAPEPFEG